jgi:hypothetical protein
MDTKKHYHLPSPSRPLCPVCKKAVYSRAGIHPQCALAQSDPLRPIKGIAHHPQPVSTTSIEASPSPVEGGRSALT